MTGRLTPRFAGMTAARRSDAAATLAALHPVRELIGGSGLTARAGRDTRTGAPLLAVRTPWRVGRTVGGFLGGRRSGGPEHDGAARALARSAYPAPMTAHLVARWDAENGGTLSLYTLTDTALESDR